MFNKQLKQNIKELDVRISKLGKKLDKVTDDEERKKIVSLINDLAELRNTLSETKTRESMLSTALPILVPAVVGLASMIMVIKHEQTNIITSKAFSIATKFIRGH